MWASAASAACDRCRSRLSRTHKGAAASGARGPARRTVPMLFHLDARHLDHFHVLVDLGLDELAKLGWRVGDGLCAVALELLLHFGRLSDRDELGVQALEYRCG